jgi:hypothetical protein
MARSRPLAHEALRKLRDQRAQLEQDEKRLRGEAAEELARIILECGAELIEPPRFRQLMRLVMERGVDGALARLEKQA